MLPYFEPSPFWLSRTTIIQHKGSCKTDPNFFGEVDSLVYFMKQQFGVITLNHPGLSEPVEPPPGSMGQIPQVVGSLFDVAVATRH